MFTITSVWRHSGEDKIHYIVRDGAGVTRRLWTSPDSELGLFLAPALG